jgi:hypothetical protein
MRKILIGAAAAAALAITAMPAQAFHFSIIGGSCFNPAGQLIPFPGALSNPHCNFGGGGGGGGGEEGGGKKKVHRGNSNTGKIVVGCIIGSAAGAITASIRKATALGNPPRWRSQAEHEKIVASGYEKQFELTNQEAATAVALCGLGSFALHWQKTAPVKAHVVKARY